MNILIPAAGATPFFPPEEFPFPKPLTEIADRPMIAWAIDNLETLEGENKVIFIALRDEAIKYSYEHVLKLLTNDRSSVVKLAARTAGALCTCLMAIDEIDPERPLLIANYDQVIDGELHDLISRFKAKGADAGVLTFNATHPRWSYVKTVGDEVVAAAEKKVISRQAIAGLYWFARGADFLDAAMKSLRAEDNFDGQYFITSALNQMILSNRKVVALHMRPTSRMHSLFLPARVHAFEQEVLAELSSCENNEQPVNIVIPAAGEGSRFAEAGYTTPKPFIDVLGKPMLQHVIENVTVRNSRVSVLLRADHLAQNDETVGILRKRNIAITTVDKLTEGTACTLLLARKEFDVPHPLLVANSDQLVDFDCQDFVDDARRRRLDGSILVFRDKDRDPKWSFAALDGNKLVTEVAEKKPISDLATVGIYLFMNGSEFVRAAADMFANNDRVNNEFYTCPVYNYIIRNGARIGVYEVPADAMSGLGTPKDLSNYLTSVAGPEARSRHAPAAA